MVRCNTFLVAIGSVMDIFEVDNFLISSLWCSARAKCPFEIYIFPFVNASLFICIALHSNEAHKQMALNDSSIICIASEQNLFFEVKSSLAIVSNENRFEFRLHVCVALYGVFLWKISQLLQCMK